VVAVTVAACSSGDDDGAPARTDDVAGTVADTVVPGTTTPAATEPSTPATEPTTTTPRDDPAETAPPATTSTTTTLPPTTTTEPLAIQELLLRGDGLGSAVFGAAPQGVIDYVTSILGGNTSDTGWVDPFTFAVCDGTIARKVSWGVLDLHFGDLSPFANGRRHFHGYDYGREGEIGNEPVGLRTPGATTLGSRVVDLIAEFPDAAVNEAQPEINSPSNFYVSDNFWGLLTGTAADDVVTVVRGGYGCGE
jgi:hypothetical protein